MGVTKLIEKYSQKSGIPNKDLMFALKQGMTIAYKKLYPMYSKKDINIVLQEDSDEFNMYLKEKGTIVEGEERFLKFVKENREKIMSDYIKKIIVDIKYNQFIGYIKSKVEGEIKKIDKDNVYIYIPRITHIAKMPKKHQMKEKYKKGMKYDLLVVNVKKMEEDVEVIVSRTANELLAEVLKSHVKEIQTGEIKVHASSRINGKKSKVAISSTVHKNPISLCVGKGASVIKKVSKDLNNERIEVIEWKEEEIEFIANAFGPKIEIIGHEIIEDKHKIEVYIPDKQLSLAIGNRGENVKMVMNLIGWGIDLKKQSDLKEKKEKEEGTDD